MSLLSFLISRKSNSLINPDKNPLVHLILKKSFYENFCAGENAAEVRRTVDKVKGMGFAGVILGYAKETVAKKDESTDVAATRESDDTISPELEAWREENLRTLELASEGDFLAMKFSGAGPMVHKALASLNPMPARMQTALQEIVILAQSRSVRILIDAEHSTIQPGIDAWVMKLMSQYNRPPPSTSPPSSTTPRATVFGTYQTYLKSTPTKLLSHLAKAKEQNFVLGVKLVRGAYISSEPREIINDSKEDTDEQFDCIAEGLLRRSYGEFSGDKMPDVNLFLATHNRASVLKASKLHKSLLQSNTPTVPVEYGQLLGMADEVSCELLQSGPSSSSAPSNTRTMTAEIGDGRYETHTAPRVYKCLSWGTVGECVSYLMRRAVENRDAVGRTREGRVELQKEVWRRVRGAFGLGS
jgi:proline dehydrogenase